MISNLFMIANETVLIIQLTHFFFFFFECVCVLFSKIYVSLSDLVIQLLVVERGEFYR